MSVDSEKQLEPNGLQLEMHPNHIEIIDDLTVEHIGCRIYYRMSDDNSSNIPFIQTILDPTKEDVTWFENFDFTLDAFTKNAFYTFDNPLRNFYELDIGVKVTRIDNAIYINGGHKVAQTAYWRCTAKTQSGDGGIVEGYICTSDLTGIVNNPFLRWASHIYRFLSKHSLIVSVIADFLLMIEVYKKNDIFFFILSLIFTVIPITSFSLVVCRCVSGNRGEDVLPSVSFLPKWCYLLPWLNVPLFLSLGENDISPIIALLLVAFMTFPQYIINLSYLLEGQPSYGGIPFWSLFQLMVAFFCLCFAPFANMISMTANIYLQKGLMLTFKDKIVIYSKIACLFVPLLILEVINFFPIIFHYFMDEMINRSQFAIAIVLFNLPKIMFIIHALKWFPEGAFCGKSQSSEVAPIDLEIQQVQEPRREQRESVTLDDARGGVDVTDDTPEIDKKARRQSIFCLLLLILMFTVLPLVPYIWFAKLDRSKKIKEHIKIIKEYRASVFYNGWFTGLARYYWTVVIYVTVSYFGMCIYILSTTEFDIISGPVKVSMLCVFLSVMVVVGSFPWMFPRVLVYLP